ncbi:hypothetical protein FXV83_23700 [Bradyrhizobium hipponense]|uniref:Uncharacterized protein n=1 Tax=Bradyrhizobium hipponense TaxID=2605638 RepID=A0A5S4YUS3_9BRAD|nr:hypothetical protein FXV83_23700 [Bradyrhizobium hipponense]
MLASQPLTTPSLRAQRSNPESFRGGILDCFVARAPRNDGADGIFATTAISLAELPHPEFKLCLNSGLSPQAGRGEEAPTP